MLKRTMVLAVVLGLVAGGSTALAFSISSSQDLSAGGSIVCDGAGNTIVREGVSLTWDWGDVNGDGTRTDPVATAGLDVQSYKVHTGNTSAVDLLLNLNGGNITGQGVWNATPYHASFSAAYRMPARYEAISTQHSANYEPPPTGDIIIKNVGDISCGAITTHTIWWYGSKSAAAGAIRIGEASGTGDGPAGNIRVDALDAQCDKQNNSGGITVYSTGFIKIQDGDNDATANLGVASTAVLSYEGRDMYYYHEGAFRAGELRANTGTGTYGTTQNGGTIYLDGDYDADGGVTTVLGDCLINKIDNAYKRNGYGDPNEHVTIQNYASVTLGDVITYNASSRYSDNHGGNFKVLGVAGDITITGAIDAHATNASANDGIVQLYTTSGSGGSVALDGGLDCDLVRYVAMDSDSGTSTIGGSLLGFDTVTRIKLRTPSGDVIKYDPFDGGNAYLGLLSYVVADLSGAAGIGGTLIPDVASRTWDGGTSGTWDADGFDDSGADAPTTATEMAKFESGATTNTVSVAAGSGAGPVAGIVRIDGGSAYTFSDGGGALGLGASGGTAYIIVADTGAAHVIDANVTLNCGTYLDMQQAGGTLTVNGDISGSQTLTKIGPGTVTLSGSNSHSATVVDAGTLVCGAVDTLPSGGAVTVNGGTLDAGANNEPLAAGVLMISGGTVNGTATISSSSAFDARSGTVNAVLGGTGGLNKTTSGTVTLGATNTYTGASAVTDGRLNVNGSTGAASSVTVTGTGVIGGTGVINGPLAVNSGGTDRKSVV